MESLVTLVIWALSPVIAGALWVLLALPIVLLVGVALSPLVKTPEED